MLLDRGPGVPNRFGGCLLNPGPVQDTNGLECGLLASDSAAGLHRGPVFD